jgi:hypothetical protein
MKQKQDGAALAPRPFWSKGGESFGGTVEGTFNGVEPIEIIYLEFQP